MTVMVNTVANIGREVWSSMIYALNSSWVWKMSGLAQDRMTAEPNYWRDKKLRCIQAQETFSPALLTTSRVGNDTHLDEPHSST